MHTISKAGLTYWPIGIFYALSAPRSGMHQSLLGGIFLQILILHNAVVFKDLTLLFDTGLYYSAFCCDIIVDFGTLLAYLLNSYLF